MKKGGSEPLCFKGSPTRLAAALRLPDSGIKARTMVVDLGGVRGRVAVRPLIRGTPGLSMLKIKLPRNTPPGTYQGIVQVGDLEVPVVALVEPHPRLRFIPSGLSVKAKPGAKVEADLTLVNIGNVTVNVERKHTFCIFDGTGIDRAVFAALGDEKFKGEQRINILMDQLADSHGGLVRLSVETGAGELAPGEARDLHVTLRFSDRLHQGRIYSGGWSQANAGYDVQIEVTEK